MGNQQETEKKELPNLSVQNWPIYQGEVKKSFLISGQFCNENPSRQIHFKRFYADEDRIYFIEGKIVRYLPLFMTLMEEKFYYSQGEQIYALKFTHNSQVTILSTYDRQNFIDFYCVLAKYCILNEFERHFYVKQQIGKGSYGTVYRGINKLSCQEVALKVFDKNKLRQNTYCKKVVQNQIYILQKLKNANLSPLYEIFQTSDCIILVLEMAKQGDLLNFLLKDETMISDKLLKQIFERILENIAALHAAGFIHRDIKPENILIRRNSNQISLFLCDFSISVLGEDNFCEEIKKLQAGSRGYLAPEVLTDNMYTEKCDLFSFGCLAYLLLAGKKLFEGISNQEIMMLTEDNEYIETEIRHLNAPKALKSLLRKVLQVDPQKRISAKEALDEEYFSDKQEEVPYLVENDETLKEFIEKRISLYEGSTRGGTSF